MADKSLIQWTDSTWPVVQGCDPISQGCAGCYAVPLLWRMQHHPDPNISGPLQGVTEKHVNAAGEKILRFTGKIALREDRLLWPLQWKTPRMIFVPSHGDLFHKDVPDEFIDKTFAVMALCPQHTFQVLTKRDKRMRDYMRTPDRKRIIAECVIDISGLLARKAGTYKARPTLDHFSACFAGAGPFPNIWLMVSAERQQEADERIPNLLQTPAAVRGVSLEPLLGPIEIWPYIGKGGGWQTKAGDVRRLDWVIVGGESGARARPMNPQWARALCDECTATGVAFFFKQWGEYLPVGQSLPGCGKVHGGTAVKPGRMQLHYGGTPQQAPKHAFAERGVEFASMADGRLTFRVGKKAAGRLLDGREWNEFPQPAVTDESLLARSAIVNQQSGAAS